MRDDVWETKHCVHTYIIAEPFESRYLRKINILIVILITCEV